MYQHLLHQQINQCVKEENLPEGDAEILFHTRFIANAAAIKALYDEIYSHHPKAKESFEGMLKVIARAFIDRPDAMKDEDDEKLARALVSKRWYHSDEPVCGPLWRQIRRHGIETELAESAGVNLLHLMPILRVPMAKAMAATRCLTTGRWTLASAPSKTLENCVSE